MESVTVSWGRKVKARREALGLTQQQLAELCSVRQGTISRIEAGDRNPREDVKWALAGALGCTLEDLFPYPAVRPEFPQPEAVGQ